MMHRRHALLFAVSALAACRRGRILSYEEYARIEHDIPYVLRFSHGHGSLLFFGSAHTYDPGDPQVGRIAALWTDFRPTLAYNEGGVPQHLEQAGSPMSDARATEVLDDLSAVSREQRAGASDARRAQQQRREPDREK